MSSKDWDSQDSRALNEHGVKARISKMPEPPYNKWRRTVGDGCYVTDIDFFEYRFRVRNGPLCPVAVIEHTYWKDYNEAIPLKPTPDYCKDIMRRAKRDGQFKAARFVAERLGTIPYYVITPMTVDKFWLCRLTDDEWRAWDEPEFLWWLRNL
jgi:hypothetical protein